MKRVDLKNKLWKLKWKSKEKLEKDKKYKNNIDSNLNN